MKSFQHTQLAFARHLRDPAKFAAPAGLEEQRVKVYRDLVYNNVANFIAGAFPIVKKVLDEKTWHKLVRNFLAQHNSQTPYFLKISQEFLQYLNNTGPHQGCPPFLLELAHYEWVELALDVAEEELPSAFGLELSVLDAAPCVSPLAWVLAYQFPVHKIGPTFRPENVSELPVFLIAYRNRLDRINFMEINALTYDLLQLLQENSELTGREALLATASRLEHENPSQLVCDGELLLQQLVAAEIIVGLERVGANHQ